MTSELERIEREAKERWAKVSAIGSYSSDEHQQAEAAVDELLAIAKNVLYRLADYDEAGTFEKVVQDKHEALAAARALRRAADHVQHYHSCKRMAEVLADTAWVEGSPRA